MESVETVKVILDLHGANSDFLNLMIALISPKIELVGVTTTAGMGYHPNIIDATLRMLKLFGRGDVSVARGRFAGRNMFPKARRLAAKAVAHLPLLADVEPDRGRLAAEPADEFIAKILLASDKKVTIVTTGPLVNLHHALLFKGVQEKIDRVIVHGGTLGDGDVYQHNSDGKAEFRFYFDGQSVKVSLRKGINPFLIPLEAHEQFKIFDDLPQRLARASQTAVFDLFGQILALSTIIHNEKHHIVLRELAGLMFLLHPKLFTVKDEKVEAFDSVPREGCLVRSEKGHSVRLLGLSPPEAENFLDKLTALLADVKIDFRKGDKPPATVKTPEGGVAKVWVDQTGSVNGILGLLLVSQNKAVELVGVGLTEGENFMHDGTTVTLKTLALLGNTITPVSVDAIYSKNDYLFERRITPKIISTFPLLLNTHEVAAQKSPEASHFFLVNLLERSKSPIKLLCFGAPLSLSKALEMRPDLKSQVAELVLVAGAFGVDGDVNIYPNDGTGEWTAFSDPKSLRHLTSIGLKVTMFPLDVINTLELGPEFIRKLAAQSHWTASRLALQVLAAGAGLVTAEHFKFFLRDGAVACFLEHPALFTAKELEIDVATEVPCQGRTRELPGSGKRVSVVQKADVPKVLDFVLETLRFDLHKS